MSISDTTAIIVVLTALFAYINARFVGLPGPIGVMLFGIAFSVVLVVTSSLGLPVAYYARESVAAIDFERLLLGGLLGFLLFAGAIEINVGALANQKLAVAFLAIAGVAISTFLVAAAVFLAGEALGHPIPWAWCVVFGALISPTDPVAVLAIIRDAGAPEHMQVKVAGESLFNDGVGIVIFLQAVAFATGTAHIDLPHVTSFLAREAVGGLAFGFAIGYATLFLLHRIDEYNVEILLTVALVMGGYAAANALGVSAPISTVVAGLIVGSKGRAYAMSPTTRRNLDTFWGLVDAMLNGVLFVLIGLEILVVPLGRQHLVAAAVAIPIVLLSRLTAVVVPSVLPFIGRCFDQQTIKILTWGGLRGGISIALALSLPPSPYRDTLIAMTYGCAVFSIAVQGLTIRRLVG
jgi:CPA1 family monovalent cation:H+ antiporter